MSSPEETPIIEEQQMAQQQQLLSQLVQQQQHHQQQPPTPDLQFVPKPSNPELILEALAVSSGTIQKRE
uniref:Uncharacterized protein n=1 Tax=Anopheles quadriannulatus TaxID=34691 RepID=A0A182XQ03_ANOQN